MAQYILLVEYYGGTHDYMLLEDASYVEAALCDALGIPSYLSSKIESYLSKKEFDEAINYINSIFRNVTLTKKVDYNQVLCCYLYEVNNKIDAKPLLKNLVNYLNEQEDSCSNLKKEEEERKLYEKLKIKFGDK